MSSAAFPFCFILNALNICGHASDGVSDLCQQVNVKVGGT